MAAVFSSAPPQPFPKPSPTSPSHFSPSAHRLPSPFRRRNHFPLHSPPKTPTSGAGAGSTGDWSLEHRLQESLAILDLMESQSIIPDAPILCSILKSCADAGNLRLGRATHEKAVAAGLHADPFVANNLLLLYSRCGMIAAARQVFDEMPARNVVSWTTAISMYHHAGLTHDALNLYRLLCDGDPANTNPIIKPNAHTYTTVLNCCAKARDFELGLSVHDKIVNDGLLKDNFIIVALIDMYTKCGKVSHARKVFDSIPEPSMAAHTAMIEGYSGNGQPEEAVELIRLALRSAPAAEVMADLGFTAMIRPFIMETALRQGQEIHAHFIKFGHNPGNKPLIALVNLYEKCDKMITAYRVFDELEVKEYGLWRRLLSGFVRNGFYTEALMVYAEMMSLDHQISHSVVVDALKACLGMRGLEEGRQIHGVLIKVENLMGSTSLSVLCQLYSSCGEDEEALKTGKVNGSNGELTRYIHQPLKLGQTA